MVVRKYFRDLLDNKGSLRRSRDELLDVISRKESSVSWHLGAIKRLNYSISQLRTKVDMLERQINFRPRTSKVSSQQLRSVRLKSVKVLPYLGDNKSSLGYAKDTIKRMVDLHRPQSEIDAFVGKQKMSAANKAGLLVYARRLHSYK